METRHGEGQGGLAALIPALSPTVESQKAFVFFTTEGREAGSLGGDRFFFFFSFQNLRF